MIKINSILTLSNTVAVSSSAEFSSTSGTLLEYIAFSNPHKFSI